MALTVLFFATWIGHVSAEWQVFTDEQLEHGQAVTAGDFFAEFALPTTLDTPAAPSRRTHRWCTRRTCGGNRNAGHLAFYLASNGAGADITIDHAIIDALNDISSTTRWITRGPSGGTTGTTGV